MNNLFEAIPADIPDELFNDLLSNPKLRIERIVSYGHASQENQWYDQEHNEWVLLIKGKAQIEFQSDNRIVTLGEGSFLDIPAHTKHRVNWTKRKAQTIWLAIHY